MQKKLTLAKWTIMSTLVISLGVACKKTGEEPPPPPPVTPKPPAGFVYIKGGSFKMGTVAAMGIPTDEQPQHVVTLNSFFMDTVELTRGKFLEFLGSEDTVLITDVNERRESYYPGTVKKPLSGVRFSTALLYCNWRSKEEGLTGPYTFNGGTIAYNPQANGYRLPTEAEWEYACRADTSVAKSPKAYFYGDDPASLGQYAWFDINSSQFIHAGATSWSLYVQQHNPFGLYDMHGNVSEWVWDFFGNYSSGELENPKGPEVGTERVYRGGNYKDLAKDLRSAKRFKGRPENRYEGVGIRLARNI